MVVPTNKKANEFRREFYNKQNCLTNFYVRKTESCALDLEYEKNRRHRWGHSTFHL